MTQTTFVKALHKEAPGLISDLSATRDPADGTSFAFRVEPTPDGVRLSIKLGNEDPRHLSFATEADAAKFIGRLYKGVKCYESAFSLLSR